MKALLVKYHVNHGIGSNVAMKKVPKNVSLSRMPEADNATF